MASRRILPALVFVASLAGLFPLAVRLAQPFATFPWNPAIDARILLLFRDHIELRPVGALAEFSPRPSGAEYTFLVPPERQEWVTNQLRNYPTPTPNPSWRLTVKSLGPNQQEIDLELIGDGIYGMVYDATNERVSPKSTRLAGPGFAFVVGGMDLLGDTLLLASVLLTRRAWRRARHVQQGSRTELPTHS